MFTYDTIVSKYQTIVEALGLPSKNVLRIEIQKHQDYAAIIKIEFIIFQDVFYPVTEMGYIYVYQEGFCTYDEPIIKTKAIDSKELRAVQTIICGIL